MSKIAIYPGTFDPITNGHLDVIERASQMFDQVIVVIGVNPRKAHLFTIEERLAMTKESLSGIPNVQVAFHEGLIVEFARQKSATIIIRGIRAMSDFEFEFQMALMNRKLEPSVTTIFLSPHEKYTYLNSSLIRELSKYGQDVTEFVTPVVAQKLKEKFNLQKP